MDERTIDTIWCRRIVRACYIALLVNLAVLAAVWALFGRTAGKPALEYWFEDILRPVSVMLLVNALADLAIRAPRMSLKTKQHCTLFLLLFFCAFVTAAHKIASVLLGSFAIPIFVSAIFCDVKLTRRVAAASCVAMPFCAAYISLGSARDYGPYLWIETLAALAGLATAYFLARVLIRYSKDNLERLRESYESQTYLMESVRQDLFTGLYNHSTFNETLPRMIERCGETGEKLTLCILDMDDFKKANDLYGHALGDRILLSTAEIIRENTPVYAAAFRYGGEEFALLCENCSAAEAYTLCENIRKLLERQAFPGVAEAFTISCGIAETQEACMTSGALFQAADSALYEAKKSGKNKTLIYSAKGRSATAAG